MIENGVARLRTSRPTVLVADTRSVEGAVNVYQALIQQDQGFVAPGVYVDPSQLIDTTPAVVESHTAAAEVAKTMAAQGNVLTFLAEGHLQHHWVLPGADGVVAVQTNMSPYMVWGDFVSLGSAVRAALGADSLDHTAFLALIEK